MALLWTKRGLKINRFEFWSQIWDPLIILHLLGPNLIWFLHFDFLTFTHHYTLHILTFYILIFWFPYYFWTRPVAYVKWQIEQMWGGVGNLLRKCKLWWAHRDQPEKNASDRWWDRSFSKKFYKPDHPNGDLCGDCRLRCEVERGGRNLKHRPMELCTLLESFIVGCSKAKSHTGEEN